MSSDVHIITAVVRVKRSDGETHRAESDEIEDALAEEIAAISFDCGEHAVCYEIDSVLIA